MSTEFVVTHLKKSAQNRLVRDFLGVLRSFGSSNIILALPSNPTETNVPACDPAVKIHPVYTSKSHSLHLKRKKKLNATANEFLKWY